ncbi:hypothetical protein FB451DRAFT_1179962 [Mycena latifolia]|nr:hypothetical protein FB451DRAFT_1179962 [Mycena latifolia]
MTSGRFEPPTLPNINSTYNKMLQYGSEAILHEDFLSKPNALLPTQGNHACNRPGDNLTGHTLHPRGRGVLIPLSVCGLGVGSVGPAEDAARCERLGRDTGGMTNAAPNLDPAAGGRAAPWGSVVRIRSDRVNDSNATGCGDADTRVYLSYIKSGESDADARRYPAAPCVLGRHEMTPEYPWGWTPSTLPPRLPASARRQGCWETESIVGGADSYWNEAVLP